MIQIGDQTYAFNNPVVIGALVAGVILLLVLVILITTMRRTGRSAGTM